jgi:hypothetical protein
MMSQVGQARTMGRAPTAKVTRCLISPDGEVLMTLGKAGVAGDGVDTFNQPSDLAIAPNGDIFVSDGHNIVEWKQLRGRVACLSKRNTASM